MEAVTGVPAADVRAAARLYATGGNGAIYYGLGVTEHAQGSTDGHGHRQPRDGDRQHRPRRRRRESAARPEQRAGLVRHGLVPARVHRAIATCRDDGGARARSSRRGACTLQPEPGLRIPNMFEAALDGDVQGPLHARARTSRSPIRTRST